MQKYLFLLPDTIDRKLLRNANLVSKPTQRNKRRTVRNSEGGKMHKIRSTRLWFGCQYKGKKEGM